MQDGQAVEKTVFGEMVDVLKHRGPDGTGAWSEGAVALGHQMLHTTPESLTEALPAGNPAQTVWITADARIDNREDMLREFELSGAAALETSDSQLIRLAYEKWGDACPEKLIGAFAFAIWDASRRRLFCARDHYGLKPFYYCHVPGRFFALASELKAILKMPEAPRVLNETAVADHLLAPVEIDATVTFFKDIHRLAPGHSMTVTAEELRSKNVLVAGRKP